MTGRIHAGSIHGDTHAANLVSFLSERGWRGATSREIRQHLDTCSVSAAAAEVRAHGFSVPCRPEPTTERGRRPFRYWLTDELMQEHDARMVAP